MKRLAIVMLSAVLGCLPVLVEAAPDARFGVNGGEVNDKNTGLTWQRCSVGTHWAEGSGCVGIVKTFTFGDAQKQANGEWRVPTKDELATLLEPSRPSVPVIDTEAFPDMDANHPSYWKYWTSTPANEERAWSVHFSIGNLNEDVDTYRFAVRLVRGGK